MASGEKLTERACFLIEGAKIPEFNLKDNEENAERVVEKSEFIDFLSKQPEKGGMFVQNGLFASDWVIIDKTT